MTGRRRWAAWPGRKGIIRRAASSRGSVAAEFAVCLPAIVLMLGIALGAVQFATLQLRAQDAATVAARMIARGDGAVATATALRLVPGASISIEQRTNLVCVKVTAAGRFAPNGMSGFALTARSCAPKAML